MSTILGFIFIVLGGMSIINPKLAWDVRTYIGRKLFSIKYTATEITYQRYKILGVFYILMGLFISVSGTPAIQEEVNEMPVPTPYQTTLTGKYECLPHKNTSGPQTMECAYGLKTSDGKHYALDFGENSLPDFSGGVTVTLTGLMTPIEYLSSDHWQIYDIVGIFSVQESN